MEILGRTHAATRRYGGVVALDSVSLEVPAGSLVGLLGPNGAGKTTLLNLLTGLRRPTSGHVELFGGSPHDPTRRRELGVTPQETGLPATLRVGEVLDFVARHFPDPLPTGEVLDRFGLGGLERRQTGGLSGGQRRRLAVALGFVGRPRLVVLDEPTTGLDVDARHALWNNIRDYHQRGGTVLLTSTTSRKSKRWRSASWCSARVGSWPTTTSTGYAAWSDCSGSACAPMYRSSCPASLA